MKDDTLKIPIGSPDEPLGNRSNNLHFDSILQRRLSRRDVLKGGLGLAVASLFGAGVTRALAAPGRLPPAAEARPPFGLKPTLGFDAVAVTRADAVTVPADYRAEAFLAWGTPITVCYPAYLDGGHNTGADQEQQVGMHHDGMHFFPLGRGAEASSHGLLVVNHEYIDPQMMHPTGPTVVGGARAIEDEVRKEIAAHGVSVVEIRRNAAGRWEVVRGRYNRRITGATPMEIRGPVRGSDFVKTKYSPDGTMTRGTLNNCAHGVTPWGTYLTCEENWAGYFVNKDPVLPREHARYGVPRTYSRYRWETVPGDAYERFNASSLGALAAQDYRNEPNAFGWVVEIDPFDPASVPKKRTALGRFAHEGCWAAPAEEGEPVVFYMGDDARDEYIYKFVTKARYHKGRANGDMLDEGTLYVARFNDDGTGEWIALEYGRNGLTPENGFASQADVLVNTRTAADFVGATKMDRPEWGAVHPQTREVYMTLTNNSQRVRADAANPRAPNPYGHIIRWREQGNRPWAERFEWDVFVLAGPSTDSRVLPEENGPTLDASNIFASPDGLWIDDRGILWIQTDMSGGQLAAGPFGNNQMLAAVPASGEIRRFLVGPVGCEVTGVVTTPDGKTMFVNIQHPGEGSSHASPSSHWPDGGSARPRSATVIITREDGGVIGS